MTEGILIVFGILTGAAVLFASACFGAMSLPVEEMVSVGATMAGCDLTPARDILFATVPSAAMARLQRLHPDLEFSEQLPNLHSQSKNRGSRLATGHASPDRRKPQRETSHEAKPDGCGEGPSPC
jgi:hypothetical protein